MRIVLEKADQQLYVGGVTGRQYEELTAHLKAYGVAVRVIEEVPEASPWLQDRLRGVRRA